MFEKDKYIIHQALNMWANYIETGDTGISAVDAAKFAKDKINPLTHEQMRMVVRIRDLAADVLNGPDNPIRRQNENRA